MVAILSLTTTWIVDEVSYFTWNITLVSKSDWYMLNLQIIYVEAYGF
jgi:hypothetical protein